MDYFEHNARRVSWEVIEIEPMLVEETDDEVEVEKVKRMWVERVDVPDRG